MLEFEGESMTLSFIFTFGADVCLLIVMLYFVILNEINVRDGSIQQRILEDEFLLPHYLSIILKDSKIIRKPFLVKLIWGMLLLYDFLFYLKKYKIVTYLDFANNLMDDDKLYSFTSGRCYFHVIVSATYNIEILLTCDT